MWSALLTVVSLSNARIDAPTLASEGALGCCAAARARGSGFWLEGRVLALRGGGKGRGSTGGGGKWNSDVIKFEPGLSSDEEEMQTFDNADGMQTLDNAGWVRSPTELRKGLCVE